MNTYTHLTDYSTASREYFHAIQEYKKLRSLSLGRRTDEGRPN
jgi:hypothetical protein